MTLESWFKKILCKQKLLNVCFPQSYSLFKVNYWNKMSWYSFLQKCTCGQVAWENSKLNVYNNLFIFARKKPTKFYLTEIAIKGRKWLKFRCLQRKTQKQMLLKHNFNINHVQLRDRTHDKQREETVFIYKKKIFQIKKNTAKLMHLGQSLKFLMISDLTQK